MKQIWVQKIDYLVCNLMIYVVLPILYILHDTTTPAIIIIMHVHKFR